MMTATATRALAVAMMTVPLALGACSSPNAAGNDAANITAAPSNSATANATVSAVPTPASTRTPQDVGVARAEQTDLLDYTLKYPAEAAALPALNSLLDQRAADAKTKALSDARDDRAAAGKNNFPFHRHEYDADWTVAGDSSRFLSLVGTIYTYTGGAHGMTVFDPILWDKQAGKPVAVADLFVSHRALEAALRSRYCAALDQERAKRRGAPVKRDSEPFDACLDPAQEVIVPTASSPGTIDGLTVYAAPYDAGPYAEGAYRIAVPIDAALVGAIKPDYRAAFKATS